MQSHTPLTLLRAHGWPPHENVAICHCQHLDSILTMNMNSMSHMNVNVIYVHINEAPSSTSCSSCVCVVDVERGRSQRLAHGSSFTSVTLAPPAPPPPGQQSFSYLEILLEIWARARAREFDRNFEEIRAAVGRSAAFRLSCFETPTEVFGKLSSTKFARKTNPQ